MTLKVAVCDDEWESVQQIQTYLLQIQKECNITFRLFFFSSGEELMDGMPRDIHVLLLDIQMRELNGMDVAKRLRMEGLDFYLFFITGKVEYALAGYEVHAYAFLRKPVEYLHLKRYLLEVAEKYEQRKAPVLHLKRAGEEELIDCSQVLYVEVFSHDTFFVFATHRRQSSVPLAELETRLKGHGFFRCHKSYLVNLGKISQVLGDSLVMVNQERIPLSKHRKKEFTAEFSRQLEAYL